MRLHVADRFSQYLGAAQQPLDLIADFVEEFNRCQRKFAAAEMLPVAIARMSPDGNARGFRQSQRRMNAPFVARMGGAGDVGRSNERHQFGVVGRSFSQVAIEIDGHGEYVERMKESRNRSCLS